MLDRSEAKLKKRVKNLKASPVEIKWHSGLPVYASEAFLRTVSDECGWIGGVDDAGQICCVLPYTIIRKLGFRIVRFRVETIPLAGEFEESVEKSFLNSVVEYFRASGADMIMPGSNNTLFRTYPDGAAVAPYGTFVIDLNRPEDFVWKEVSEAYRKDIRRAIKTGVQIKEGVEYHDAAYTLVADTLNRSGVKHKKKYEDFKASVLALGENVKVLVAVHDGIVQASLFTPFSEYSAYSQYGGTVAQPVRGAMHLLHWEAIRRFHAMGVKRFNFTGVRIDPKKGSKQDGILTFKKRFGGSLIQGYMWKYSFSFLKFAAYSASVRLLFGGDIVDVERHKLAAH